MKFPWQRPAGAEHGLYRQISFGSFLPGRPVGISRGLNVPGLPIAPMEDILGGAEPPPLGGVCHASQLPTGGSHGPHHGLYGIYAAICTMRGWSCRCCW